MLRRSWRPTHLFAWRCPRQRQAASRAAPQAQAAAACPPASRRAAHISAASGCCRLRVYSFRVSYASGGLSAQGLIDAAPFQPAPGNRHRHDPGDFSRHGVEGETAAGCGRGRGVARAVAACRPRKTMRARRRARSSTQVPLGRSALRLQTWHNPKHAFHSRLANVLTALRLLTSHILLPPFPRRTTGMRSAASPTSTLGSPRRSRRTRLRTLLSCAPSSRRLRRSCWRRV